MSKITDKVADGRLEFNIKDGKKIKKIKIWNSDTGEVTYEEREVDLAKLEAEKAFYEGVVLNLDDEIKEINKL